ncbi:hypothetical protein ACDA63_04950 [Uliginosibacterium sp. sgz301328]|uniref:hypothetical protein n=1 Tax=Uliginosibacterium sp. sgz301328 TaxID=3243764 RepID=UPI00359DC154
MKISPARKRMALIAITSVVLAVPAVAQTAPGAGGPGFGRQGWGQYEQGGQRMGRGMGAAGGRAPAAMLMTPEERSAHLARMREVKTYDECRQIQTEHRALMVSRAQERGVSLPAPRQNGCDNMKARGFIK